MSDTPERDPVPVSVGRREPGLATSEGRSARTREPGRPAPRAEATERAPARHRIGIRELRQHASVYVDLAEKGYTVDITNRGRLVAQLVPAGEPGSPLERLMAAGIIEPAEEAGGVVDLEPYPARATRPPSTRTAGSGTAGSRTAGSGTAGGDEAQGQGKPEGRR